MTVTILQIVFTEIRSGKTFVSPPHRMVTAEGLFKMMNNLFDEVIYIGKFDLDTSVVTAGSGNTSMNPMSLHKSLTCIQTTIQVVGLTPGLGILSASRTS
ncbi:hypothetical protein KQX54_000362, partial [Cotesia glomerata]